MSQRCGPLLPRPGIFVMRNGVICQRDDVAPKRGAHVELVPGALEGLRLLARLGAPMIVLSCHGEQTFAAGATQPSSAPRDSHRQLRNTLRTHGARVDGIRSYPIMPQDGTQCERKALVRLLQRAARLYTIDLTSSVLIGDSWTDVQAATDVGCQPVLVMTGRGREQITVPQLASIRSRTWYVADLAGAALSVDAYLDSALGTQTVA